ncbi:nucleoside triphosphate pyrophosphohydrolase [Lentilitoribacter sp. Alg239-R112]|jgi:ATP diphosphatase|uniref:nucleoside triphosphate pyrophosphohydrolase n=1 Tax=Lentilitoribacter sp. Alg239-R112 TaxID=2305987 RepID=UPI0013A6AF4E|nr:nucleoside triphosphate pyrophosphohydrolase [Lentilitoribacter sp. Alg239-R112]
MTPSNDIVRLLEVMAALRDKETGCPWDIEQNFETIKPYTLEEAYEVADAIERNDPEDLCDELGDLLLQVVFHAQMAKEEGLFSFEDVVYAINKKMIRRHPHVFGDGNAKTGGEVKVRWDEIKAEEKQERSERRRARGLAEEDSRGLLDTVSRAMPANEEALKIQQKASKVGFDWNDPSLVLDKMEEEIAELRAEISKGNKDQVADEMGDLMFVLVNLARHLNVNPEMALRGTNTKFRKRFSYIEQSLADNNLDIKSATLEQMEALWVEAKSL